VKKSKEKTLEITLNHTIVPTKDNVKSAKFYERIFGFKFIKEWGNFAVVEINSSLTFDFMNEEKFSSIHYAFKVTNDQFDEIFERVIGESLEFSSDPYLKNKGKINSDFGGRGVYFKDLDGHLLEILTVDYELD
jgi:catechol 2,3-dioxygenase-like lactoylglutathione lyase family enzyme